MNVSTPMPSTIQFRPSRLVGLMAIVAALAAAITCVLLVFAVDPSTELSGPSTATNAEILASLDAPEREYVEGIMSLGAEELAAVFGTSGVEDAARRAHAEAIASLSGEELAAAYGNTGVENAARQAKAEAIAALSPEQLAAAFGNVPADVLSTLSPQEREYVEEIAALTPEQLAAAFGTEVGLPLDFSFYSAE